MEECSPLCPQARQREEVKDKLNKMLSCSFSFCHDTVDSVVTSHSRVADRLTCTLRAEAECLITDVVAVACINSFSASLHRCLAAVVSVQRLPLSHHLFLPKILLELKPISTELQAREEEKKLFEKW